MSVGEVLPPLPRLHRSLYGRSNKKEGATIAKLNEFEFHALLEERAESVARDIKGDFPEHDVSYDMYVETMENGEIVGVINMGDLYHEVFMDCDDGTIDPDPSLDPFDTTERIIQKRMNGGW